MKEPSGPAIYEMVAVDAYQSPKKVPHFAQYIDLPTDDGLGLPYNLVINLMVPRYAPNLVWSAAGDGESWCVVLYCRLTEDALDLLRKNEPSPALKLWKAFVEAERQEPMKKRLKCIVRAVNADEVGFNTATRSLINKYNGKPFLVRTTSSFYGGPHYYEIDIDIHNFGKTARIALYSCSEVATQVTFEYCVVIQGEEDDELPEQLLCSVRLDKLDPSKVPTIPFTPKPTPPAAPIPNSPKMPVVVDDKEVDPEKNDE
jgi:hypothetical protein